ncbi:ABC transporter ATP-binding protein [Halarchaeum grantii]|uniref:ABC transporter ATP-binding protein n=1 Tax=Halarchaeum grantii TaxID=1193105 RepID=A0A830FAD9_9EURY|nr:ABC transporter ATP-binding protein [Halarchaeum grantii]GGL35271.1 ABC transporter ATP-binding protein [Halarchaeum grantii]
MTDAFGAGTPEHHSDVEAGETLVRVADLRTYYGETGRFGGTPVKAVDGVSLDIEKGETLGLVGESGSGKTTLGRTLVRLEQATGGRVEYAGTDVTALSGDELRAWRRNAQMVFQDPESSLNERLPVGELVKEPLDVHGWRTPRERRERVRDLLERVGLAEEHYYRYPHQFSGGQRQRVGIARALALEPEFVVLDEPVSALDASVQAKILNLLGDLQDDLGLTYLLIAHDLSVVEHVCDRVAVLYLGQLLEVGPVADVFDDPANPYTHALLSAIPDPDPTTETARITLRGTPPSARDPPSGCRFSTRCPAKIRPEAYEGLDDDVWDAVEAVRDVLRQRANAEVGALERLAQYAGLADPHADVEEVISDAFAGLDVPAGVERTVDAAAGRAASGDVEGAERLLADEFGSECERAPPTEHAVGESGRISRCHRHEPGVQSPSEYFADHDRR